ncbi:MAG: hypothetical protein KDE20_16440, partial [Caldilineaceae bacterium]|nr:hypothetical protein [Caldilineaceae bacterium]
MTNETSKTNHNQPETRPEQRPDSDISLDWLFGKTFSAEETERRRREAKVETLLREDEDDILGKAYDAKLVGRLLEFMQPYRTQLIIAVILMVISSIMSVAGPWIVGKAIDDGIRLGDMRTLRMWTLFFLGASLVEWVTNRSRIAIMAFVGTKVVADMRSGLFRHLHKLSLNFHNNYSVGRLMSRLISDVGVLQDFVTWSITGLARSVFILLGIIIAMLAMNWQLALVTFAVLPLMMVLTNFWRKRVRSAYRATRQRLSL